jgi:excinuclease UvrABC nuclease subunit
MNNWNKPDGTWQSSLCGPPNKAGVYCVMSTNIVTKERSVSYIGSSKNILKRVMNPSHPYRKLYSISKWPVVISTKFKVCTDYKILEKRMIKKLRPKYNIQHTGIEYGPTN